MDKINYIKLQINTYLKKWYLNNGILLFTKDRILLRFLANELTVFKNKQSYSHYYYFFK